jgi:uncharacterized membrane protein
MSAPLLILLFLAFLGCSIAALVSLLDLKQRMKIAERNIQRMVQSDAELRRRVWTLEQAAVQDTPSEAPTAAPQPAAEPVRLSPIQTPVEKRELVPPPLAPSPRVLRSANPARDTGKEAWSSLEVRIGAKWLNWVGVVLVVVGAMFFLKYAYDTNWIGPAGRIAIAAIAGAGALVLGEKTRRAGLPILFHSLTGGGIALFYGCIYFSFQVYGLTGQAVSFILSILVTALAVALALIHNAPGICLLGQFGGFLSPVLLSTGTNRPIELFSFVAILNLTTIGCAYRKDWRHVNAAGFIGTWLLYAGWAGGFYDASQIGIALFFSALFFVMFLIAPMLQALSRRRPMPVQNLWLVAAGIFVEFCNNCALLSGHYRAWLGLAVVLQAGIVATLYAQWTRRSEDSRMGQTLLFFILALTTVAIPIQLRLYAIPIGWALEALLLGFVGQRYRNWQFQLGALVATLLAALGLAARLPLHTALFSPVFNRPFGSWMTVIAMTAVLSAVLYRKRDRIGEPLRSAIIAPGALALILLCTLAHLEISAFWNVRADQLARNFLLSYKLTSLAILWSAIPAIFLGLGKARRMKFSVQAAFVAHGVAVLLLLSNVIYGIWIVPDIPFLNLQWLSRALIVASFWVGARWMRSIHDRPGDWVGWIPSLHALETAGHAIFAFLLLVEVNSWMSSSRIFSPFMRYGFISALWSLQALTLIGIGLWTRSQVRRIVGFVLFGVTVAKVLIVDMALLEPVYRILSFAATGVLLIVAAYLYQQFATKLLETPEKLSQAASGGSS